MRRRVVAVLAVATLALLAGCSGFAPDGTDGEATPTLTPAPVPEGDLPTTAGVSAHGLDGETILENHEETLENTSYTAVERLRVGPEDNASFSQERRAWFAAGGTPFRVDDEVTGAQPGVFVRETERWWDGDRAYYRHTFGDERYTFNSGDNRPNAPLRIDNRFTAMLDSLSVTTIEDGPGESIIVAGSIDDTADVPRTNDLSRLANATATVRIDDGAVTRMAVGYDANYPDGGRQHVRYSYRVTAIGETTVEPPSWLEEYRTLRGE